MNMQIINGGKFIMHIRQKMNGCYIYYALKNH